MQRAEEPSSGSTTEPTRAPGLSPVKGFLLLGLVLAVILGAVALTTGESEQQATGEPGERTPSFALTDAEAIERFRELEVMSVQAYENRDPSLISVVSTSDSPLRERVVNEITKLSSDNVTIDIRFVTRRLSVMTNTEEEIRIVQLVEEYTRFFDKSGTDISASDEGLLRKIEWTLHPEDGEWKIHDSRVIRSRVLASHAK